MSGPGPSTCSIATPRDAEGSGQEGSYESDDSRTGWTDQLDDAIRRRPRDSGSRSRNRGRGRGPTSRPRQRSSSPRVTAKPGSWGKSGGSMRGRLVPTNRPPAPRPNRPVDYDPGFMNTNGAPEAGTVGEWVRDSETGDYSFADHSEHRIHHPPGSAEMRDRLGWTRLWNTAKAVPSRMYQHASRWRDMLRKAATFIMITASTVGA